MTQSGIALHRCRCKYRAMVYYESDVAFLYQAYDVSIYDTNFLVARHICQVTCATCHSLDVGYNIYGADLWQIYLLCASYNPNPIGSPLHSMVFLSFSSCIFTSKSTATPWVTKPIDPQLAAIKQQRGVDEKRVEVALPSWNQTMGLQSKQRCVEVTTCMIGSHQETTATLSL